jgi:hypothetical protein
LYRTTGCCETCEKDKETYPCPVVRCAAPSEAPRGCVDEKSDERDSNGCLVYPCGFKRTCKPFVCPLVRCAAPRAGCRYVKSNALNADSCPRYPCGVLQCDTCPELKCATFDGAFCTRVDVAVVANDDVEADLTLDATLAKRCPVCAPFICKQRDWIKVVTSATTPDEVRASVEATLPKGSTIEAISRDGNTFTLEIASSVEKQDNGEPVKDEKDEETSRALATAVASADNIDEARVTGEPNISEHPSDAATSLHASLALVATLAFALLQ